MTEQVQQLVDFTLGEFKQYGPTECAKILQQGKPLIFKTTGFVASLPNFKFGDPSFGFGFTDEVDKEELRLLEEDVLAKLDVEPKSLFWGTDNDLIFIKAKKVQTTNIPINLKKKTWDIAKGQPVSVILEFGVYKSEGKGGLYITKSAFKFSPNPVSDDLDEFKFD